MEKFEKGCSLNNAMSCFYISGMFISGIENVVERNMEKAFEYSKKACELGNVYSCANLSQMYKKVLLNVNKPEHYFEKFF